MRIENFFLQGDIGHSGLPQFLTEATGYHGETVEAVQLTIWINSSGGDLLAALEAINLIRSSPIPVVTVINGHAESAALLIAMSGHRRFAFDTSWGMAHHFSTAVEGSYHDLMDMVRSNQLLDNAMRRLYKDFTKVTDEDIETKMMGRGTLWMGPDELVEYGLVDEIISGREGRSKILRVWEEKNAKTTKKKVSK